jgi:5'-deoxynucleotidase YfbR-like HD superfamily hydrolase
MKLNTADLLRMSTVKRWQIVDVARPQSVAEHTFNVIAIALRLAQQVVHDNDISGMLEDEYTRKVMMYAFIHDMAEVVTGDIPTPVKSFLSIGEKLKEIENRFTYLGVGPTDDDFDDDVVSIVKSADMIEALLYLSQNVDLDKESHAKGVYDGLKSAVENRGLWDIFTDICEERKTPMTMDVLAEIMATPKLSTAYGPFCEKCATGLTVIGFCPNVACSMSGIAQEGIPF